MVFFHSIEGLYVTCFSIMIRAKKYYLLHWIIGPIFILTFGCGNSSRKVSDLNSRTARHYEETWESLSGHIEAPDWFRDAKLGIYFHWGVYSVPAFESEWYPHWMHFPGHQVYEHHLEKYGHPSVFGYHDFVPMFTAEHFDAEEWAELFQRAGARFAGPVAEHHDGFSMWDSEITPWKSMDRGPMKDITGELRKALQKRDMKLITTFHHARNLQRYTDTIPDPVNPYFKQSWPYWNSHYPPIEGMPALCDDEDLKYLYGNIPQEQWLEEVWFGKLKEVIDKYQPDIIWFDLWLDQIPDSLRRKFCAYYLNQAELWKKEVVIVSKLDQIPHTVSVDDLEKSRKNELGAVPWMSDETISMGSWCYTENLQVKAAKDVLHVLIDITSKNGILLLNVSPKANGTIPEEQRKVLLELGDWLEQYGEAIYDTRPWYTYGEGPVKEPPGHFLHHKEFLKIKYSEKDIRYTTRQNSLYAILLGRPDPGSVVNLLSFSTDSIQNPPGILQISLLGSDAAVEWDLDQDGLKLTVPDAVMHDMAVIFRIETL